MRGRNPHFSDLTPIETACLAFACAVVVVIVFIALGGVAFWVVDAARKAAGL